VFGVPDEEFGETVTAVVQPLNWADATDEVAIELMEWLRERLAHLKVPKALHWHPKLPRMDNGKLYKRHLAEEFRGGARADDGPSVDPESDGKD
jgi:fatty-acyl-CoA synthase